MIRGIIRFGLAVHIGAVASLTAFAQVQGIAAPGQPGWGYFGQSTASVPDVDGDGRSDLAVLTPNQGVGNGSTGRVHLYSGATGVYLRSLNPLPYGNFQAGTVFQGGSVAGVPDIDGDGRGDVIVGAPFESPGTSPVGAGRAYLFSGRTGALLRVLRSPSDESNGNFGNCVSGIPDVDGDGRGDVIVGAMYENPATSPTDCGRAYIFSGATGVLLWRLRPPTPQQFGDFGNYVAGIPDVNGDGRGDVIVGAIGESTIPGVSYSEGRAHLYSGATGVRLRTLSSPRQVQLGGFGQTVSGVPDVDGDGRGDILISAPGHDPASNLPLASGMAYLYSGASGALLRSFASPNSQVNGSFGFSISGIPDVTGDGRGDLIIGAPYEDVAGMANAGRAYIYSGATGVLFRSLVSPNREIDGTFGWSAAGLANSNGNGRGGVVIGAPGDDPGVSPTDCGRAYIIRY